MRDSTAALLFCCLWGCGGGGAGGATASGSTGSSSGSSTGSSSSGDPDAGTWSACADGGTIGVLSTPAPAPLGAHDLPSTSGDLVPTSSGALWVRGVAGAVAATPISAAGTVGATTSLAVPVNAPFVIAAPGCGGAVVAGGTSDAGSKGAYLAILGEGGASSGVWPLDDIGKPRSLVSFAEGIAIAASDQLLARGCDGAARWSVPLTALSASCAGMCAVSRCAFDGGGSLGCVAVDRTYEGFLTVEHARAFTRIDTKGIVQTQPAALLPGIDGETVDVASCGVGCFDVIVATTGGAFVQRVGSDGAPAGAPRPLPTIDTFIQAKVIHGPGYLALITGPPGTMTVLPQDLYLFDATTLAPLVGDALGRATPLDLPKGSGDCNDFAVLAGAASAAGLTLIHTTAYHTGDMNVSCKPAETALFVGCR